MENPCINCIVLALCKTKFKDRHVTSIASFSLSAECPLLSEYFNLGGQDEVNELRVIYGLEPVK